MTDENKLLKYASKPTYVSSKIFNENLVAVHKIKETLALNRPAYVGMCILDLSKTLMYDFNYNYIKDKYQEKARLLFTDTDSLTYEIEAEDVYNDFQKDKDRFDNSDYPKESPYFDATNKKVIGKFKDEAAGVPIWGECCRLNVARLVVSRVGKEPQVHICPKTFVQDCLNLSWKRKCHLVSFYGVDRFFVCLLVNGNTEIIF